MISFKRTDVGVRRSTNQDTIFASDTSVGRLPNLYIVADGMGGEQAGDYASRKCVDVIVDTIKKTDALETVKIFEQAIQMANGSIITEAKQDPKKAGMGTTLVMATIFDGHMYVANVGDSRLYVALPEGLKQITRDHSVVAELIRTGELDEKNAKNDKRKNMITRAIGAEKTIVPDYFDVELNGGESVLLCSDGLTNMVSDRDIFAILSDDDTLEGRGVRLIDMANRNGGKDNVSVIIVE